MARRARRIAGAAAAAALVALATTGCKDKSEGASSGGDQPAPKPAPTTSVPADFSLTHGRGPLLGGIRDRVTISADGKGGYAQVRVSTEDEALRSDPVPVPGEVVLAIYQEVVRQKFFELKDEYDDPAVMDGGIIELAITADGKTKSVRLINVDQPQVFAILDRLPKPPPPLPE